MAGLVKALHEVNSSSWQDTFLGLWFAALRLVNRVSIYAEIPSILCQVECNVFSFFLSFPLRKIIEKNYVYQCDCWEGMVSGVKSAGKSIDVLAKAKLRIALLLNYSVPFCKDSRNMYDACVSHYGDLWGLGEQDFGLSLLENLNCYLTILLRL